MRLHNMVLYISQGRTRLWSDSGLTASTSSYAATALNTTATITTNSGNTGTLVKSTSDTSRGNSNSSLHYLGCVEIEVDEEKGDLPKEDRYGIIVPASNQRQDSTQPLECILEDAEEANALEVHSLAFFAC